MEFTNELQGFGPLNSKIWFIGKAPREQDIESKRIFSDGSGKLLLDTLSQIGFNIDNVRFETLIGVRPPGNNFEWFKLDEERKAYLEQSIKLLKSRIKENQPNLVVLLGGEVLEALGNRYGIGDWRGHIIWSEELGCKLLSTYEPLACIKQRYVDKKNHPGQYEALFIADLTKSTKEFLTPDLTHEQYRLLLKPSFSEARNYLLDLLENAPIISYDIETVGNCIVDCIAFCSSPTYAASIPLYRRTPEGISHYWEVERERLEIFRLIRRVLESDIPKVAQNSQYDDIILEEYYKVDVRNLIWDTMVAAHSIYSELPKDLGTLISLYTNIPYTKHLGKSSYELDHWKYNATDAIANLHVMVGQLKEMDEYGILTHYRTLIHPSIRVLRKMQITGVNVDHELQAKAIAREEYLQEEILHALDKVFPIKISTNKKFTHKFNPRSSDDKKRLFIDMLGCKAKVEHGRLTLDKNTMERYAKDSRKSVGLLAKVVQKYSLSGAMLGRLKTPLHHGRMCCAYSIGGVDIEDEEIGTDTGRLASKTSIFGSGTNLQNLKPGIQRQQLIPDISEGFAHTDQWAAEAYLTALDAGEIELLKMLDAGKKIHKWMLDVTKEKFPKECEGVKYDYKKAKQTVHALDYGVEAGRMSEESGLPSYVCEWQYTMFHNKFIGIKLRMLRIKRSVEDSRRLVSMLGRHKVFIAPMSNDVLKQAYAWPSQSTIGETTLIGMTKLFYMGKCGTTWIFPALNTHDGLCNRYKLGTEKEVKQLLINAFNIPIKHHDVTITIPIEIGFGKNFNDIEGKEVIWYANR